MHLNLFYTMVQKSQKWPKTEIKGGSCLKSSLVAASPFSLDVGPVLVCWMECIKILSGWSDMIPISNAAAAPKIGTAPVLTTWNSRLYSKTCLKRPPV